MTQISGHSINYHRGDFRVKSSKDKKYNRNIPYHYEGNNTTDADFALSIFHIDREKALSSFIEFISQENDDKCMDIPEKRQITDDDAIKIIKERCRIDYATDMQKFDANKRNSCLKDLKGIHGLSIRQIERLTGIGMGTI